MQGEITGDTLIRRAGTEAWESVKSTSLQTYLEIRQHQLAAEALMEEKKWRNGLDELGKAIALCEQHGIDASVLFESSAPADSSSHLEREAAGLLEALLKNIESHLDKGKATVALEQASRAIEVCEEYQLYAAPAYYWKGRCLYALEDLENALAAFSKAIDLSISTQVIESYLGRSDTYRELAVRNNDVRLFRRAEADTAVARAMIDGLPTQEAQGLWGNVWSKVRECFGKVWDAGWAGITLGLKNALFKLVTGQYPIRLILTSSGLLLIGKEVLKDSLTEFGAKLRELDETSGILYKVLGILLLQVLLPLLVFGLAKANGKVQARRQRREVPEEAVIEPA